jgi:CTP:molybdopterin cytidylyltransferase MocA
MLFGKKKKQPPFVTAIIPAAGSSRRMGGGNKLLMELDGVPVLGRTLLAEDLDAAGAIAKDSAALEKQISLDV